MTEMNPAPQDALPSSRKLARSTAIAAAAAGLLLITVVMPAEYGVDPTGVGRVLGLTEMGEIKVQLAKEAAADAAATRAVASGAKTASGAASTATPAPTSPPATSATPAGRPPSASAPAPLPAPGASVRTDEISVTLRPNEGKEVKLAMQKGARVNYTWSTDRGVVNYDTHADRTAPPAIKYHGYAKGQGKRSDEGVLVSAFDGMHGWFWRNRTSQDVTVTLRTSGEYRELKRME